MIKAYMKEDEKKLVKFIIYMYVFYNKELATRITVTPKLVKDLIVSRIVTSRKGDNGIVLVVGGNRIYHGAPILASIAALKIWYRSCIYGSTEIHCYGRESLLS